MRSRWARPRTSGSSSTDRADKDPAEWKWPYEHSRLGLRGGQLEVVPGAPIEFVLRRRPARPRGRGARGGGRARRLDRRRRRPRGAVRGRRTARRGHCLHRACDARVRRAATAAPPRAASRGARPEPRLRVCEVRGRARLAAPLTATESLESASGGSLIGRAPMLAPRVRLAVFFQAAPFARGCGLRGLLVETARGGPLSHACLQVRLRRPSSARRSSVPRLARRPPPGGKASRARRSPSRGRRRRLR